jgi:DNA-binding transcriptional LysR family regulator
MRDSDWQILNELYKTKNITRAANRLFITQPSLTKRLKQMEEEFQVTIVTRTTKGVAFTPEGEFLASKAEEYLQFMAVLRKNLRSMQNSKKTVILLGSSYTFSKNELPEIILDYTQEHPNVSFNLDIEQSNLLYRKACDGEVDAAFIRGDYDGEIIQRPVGEYRGYLVTKDEVSLDQLPEMQRVKYKTNDKTREIIEGWWQDQYGDLIPEGSDVGYIDVAWQILSMGSDYFTIVFLPEDFSVPGGLRKMPLYYRDGRPVIRHSWFVYRENKAMPRALREFIQYVNDYIVTE